MVKKIIGLFVAIIVLFCISYYFYKTTISGNYQNVIQKVVNSEKTDVLISIFRVPNLSLTPDNENTVFTATNRSNAEITDECISLFNEVSKLQGEKLSIEDYGVGNLYKIWAKIKYKGYSNDDMCQLEIYLNKTDNTLYIQEKYHSKSSSAESLKTGYFIKYYPNEKISKIIEKIFNQIQ